MEEEVREVARGRGDWLTQEKRVRDVGVEVRRGHAETTAPLDEKGQPCCFGL